MCVDWHLQGVIKLGEKASESKCTLVYGQMNEPPGARARVALTGNVAVFCWSCVAIQIPKASSVMPQHGVTMVHQALPSLCYSGIYTGTIVCCMPVSVKGAADFFQNLLQDHITAIPKCCVSLQG